MGLTAVVALSTAYQISSSEQAKKKQREQEQAAKEQQAKVEADLRFQEKKAKNNAVRDQARIAQESGQAQANGRGSTLLTSPLDGAAVGTATSTGGGKTLLGT